MANEQNLTGRGFDELTAEEQREIARKGGKASVEARRRKKQLKECLDVLLEREMQTKDGETVSGAEAISIAVFKKALKGDLRAYELVRDTAGQKPVEKIAVNEIPKEVEDEIESILAEYDKHIL